MSYTEGVRKPLFTVHCGKEKSMFSMGELFFWSLHLIARPLGFGGLAGTAAGAAEKIVFVVGIMLVPEVSLFTGRDVLRRPAMQYYLRRPKHFFTRQRRHLTQKPVPGPAFAV